MATISRAMRDTGGGGLGTPSGASLFGATMYIVDEGDDAVYTYPLTDLFSAGGNLSASSAAPLDGENEDPQGI